MRNALKSAVRALATLALIAVVSAPARAIEPGAKVDNFRLLDHRGKSHELHSLAGMKAVVIMVQGNGCPIVRQALPALAEVRARYRNQGVEFLLLNSNLQDTRELVAREADEFSIDFPILLDGAQHIGEMLRVVRTSEVFVIDPKDWKLKYRGPMDDRLSYERQRPARNHYLTDALDALLAGKPVTTPYAEGVGCLINFPERERQVSHSPMSH
ncbi:redoxin family protein [Steroidobacter sp. S1-65]|uniref:Redoxin family protein n=1 Tax=Steroidobacter gossypii TaxID=2805490 RepID=A0ABS1WRV9_9GAMM|nr:redoxin family protein [Steroidobacter gossypii]MBM0103700.1 redoxin family protein [Steroidobacter gossypii]